MTTRITAAVFSAAATAFIAAPATAQQPSASQARPANPNANLPSDTGSQTTLPSGAVTAVAFAGVSSAAGSPPREAGPAVLSGGVGEGARAQLAEQARDYSLKLVFTLSTGTFISDVALEVISAGQVIVSDVAKGPWAFVKLQPGAYTVRATYEGHTQTRKVTVSKKGQRRLPFSWPAPQRVQEQPKQ